MSQEDAVSSIEFRVAVWNNVPVMTAVAKGFPQLLQDPTGCRLRSDIEVQDPPTAVLDNEEAVQQLERDRWNCKEIECKNCLAVIREQRKPTLCRVARRRTRFRYLASVRSDTAKPSLSSSPCIFGPQPAFSAAVRRISVLISSATAGRPPRACGRQRQ
jgi:hypothetical protein